MSEQPAAELRAVEPPLGGLAGASLARHGVRDVHRAHYLNLFALLQDGTPSRTWTLPVCQAFNS